MRELLTDSLKRIIENKACSSSCSTEDMDLLYGTLEVVAGLIKIVQPGSNVNLNLNGKQCVGTVVDGGFYSGKLDLSIIMEDENTITNLTQEQAKEAQLFESHDKITWKEELLPDPTLVNEAISACLKAIKDPDSKTKSNRPDSKRMLLLMLLKISLLYDSEKFNIENLNTIEPLLNICDEYHSNAVEIPSEECELELCEAWRRIVDKLEPVLNYHYTLQSNAKSSKSDKTIKPDNSDISIYEHTLPSSGYDQLPRPRPKANESKAAIRLLAYWEKNIIPKLIEFVKGQFKPWEMEFSFEQLRFPLRHGDQQGALKEALIMWEKKIPAGVVIPDDSYDWSAKMPEECIVGSWFLVKNLPELKAQFGVEEIVVMLKAVDFETKIGLVEYIDIGSMRYNMWIPLKYMYDLPIPLNVSAVCCPLRQLKETYENKLMAVNAYYAKKIIISHYTQNCSIGRTLSATSDKVARVKDIISWILTNEYSQSPVSGVQNIFKGLYDDSIPKYLDCMSQKELVKQDLPELVQVCATNTTQKGANAATVVRSKEKLIAEELTEILKSGNKDAILNLFKWVQEQWDILSDNIKNQKIDIDICREYHRYAGISESSSVTADGQEVIECRDNSVLLPLHNLFSEEVAKKFNVGMVVSFDKSAYFCCSTATVKFYSDERGANLIAEISSASEQGTQIRPLLFNHGKVWCMFDAGTSAILPKHMQTNVTGSLKCSVTLIPYEWSICCTMTSNISNSLVKAHAPDNAEFESEVYKGLITHLIKFYRNAAAPASVNSIIFQLSNKLIQNYRTLKLRASKEGKEEEASVAKHFERIHVDKNWIQELITEVDTLKSTQSDMTGAKTLFSSYLQYEVELIVGTLLPTARGERLKSISEVIELPSWLESVAQAALILAHLESPKNHLSEDIEQACYDQTKITTQWERLMIVSKLPQDWTRQQLYDEALKIVKKHRGIVLDVYIPEDSDFEATKTELQKDFDYRKKLVTDFEQDYKALEENLKEMKEKIEEEKQAKEEPKSSISTKSTKSAKKQAGTPKKVEEVKTPEVIEEDKKENEVEKDEKEHKDEQVKPKEDEKGQESTTEQVNEDKGKEETVPVEPNWKEYNHQGAVIILLDEFDLGLLTEEDLKEGDEPEEEEKEPELPPELNIYNCPACTLENPMSNESCAVCGTPRPPDAGMQRQNENENKEPQSEEGTKIIEEKYALALKNRVENIVNDFKEITPTLVAKEKEEEKEREAKLANVQKEIDVLKGIRSGVTAEKQNVLKEDIKEVESMELGNLFKEPEPTEESKKAQAESEKKEEDKKVESTEESNKQDSKPKEETKKSEEPAKPDYTPEARPDVKVYFGHTIDDDFKSELYMNDFLKQRLITKDEAGKEKLVEELSEEKQGEKLIDNPDEFLKLAKENPKAAWDKLENLGLDLCFEPTVFKSLQDAMDFKVNKVEQNRILRLIALDICNDSILAPTFRGNGLRKNNPNNNDQNNKFHDYEITRDWVNQRYPGLLKIVGLREIRYYWALLRFLNKQLYTSIYLIYCSEPTSKGSSHGDSFSLPELLSKFRIIIHSIKFDLKQCVLDKTSIDREKAPELVFERLKIAHFKHEKDTDAIEIEPLSDEEGVEELNENSLEKSEENYTSLLYNSYEQMSQLDITLFRPKRPQGAEPHLSFSVVFRGEHVVGEGGPYRQFFADLSSEIQPLNYNPNSDDNEVTILVPTPNNVGDVKDFKEYFVINPSCISTQDLALYEYLGVLMGVCIRTNVHLTLDLATLCWKPLVGEQITLQDMNEIDVGFVTRCQYILECPKETFEDTIFETFAVTLSDGSVQELCEDGMNTPVTFENKNDFLVKAISARLGETIMQCRAIKNGISKLIPEGLLNLMTADELREAVCGKVKCDLELLKRNTEYGGSNSKELENSKHVKWFWEVLEEMTEEDKLKFIVFCWGQERLPANDEEFKLSKTRFMIKPPVNEAYGDGALPRANTCFFNFELPSYSSKEVLREKLLLAIRTDNRSMNAEQRELLEHQGQNEISHDDDY